MQHTGRVRDERLRDVADQCLILAGLFPGLARRRVSPTYFIDLGRGALSGTDHGVRRTDGRAVCAESKSGAGYVVAAGELGAVGALGGPDGEGCCLAKMAPYCRP